MSARFRVRRRRLAAWLAGGVALAACAAPVAPATSATPPASPSPGPTAMPLATATASPAASPTPIPAAPAAPPATPSLAPLAPGQKLVPIRVPTAGLPAAGVRLEAIVTTPAAVLLTGDPAVLDSVSAVATESVDLHDQQESFQRRLVIRLPIGARSPRTTVQAEIRLSALPGQIQARLPVIVRGLPLGWRAEAEPATAEVILTGPITRLQAVSVEALRLEVAVPRAGPGRYQIQPQVVGPGVAGLRTEIRPAEVDVQVDQVPVYTADRSPTAG